MAPPGFPEHIIQKSEIMERLAARAKERGLETTSEQLEAAFSQVWENNQKQYDAGETKTMILDFDDPAAQRVNLPHEAALEGIVKGVTGNYLDPFPDSETAADDPLSRFAGAGGHLFGMIGGPVKGLGALGQAAKIPATVAGPLAFGAYGAGMKADSMKERGVNALYNTLLGFGLQVAPGLTAGAAGKISPKAGEAVKKVLDTKAGTGLFNLGIFTGLAKAENPDVPLKEMAPEILGGTLAATAMHPTGRLKKTPAETPKPTRQQAEIDALIKEANKWEKTLDDIVRENVPRELTAKELKDRAQNLVFDRAVKRELADIESQLHPQLPVPVSEPAFRARDVVTTTPPPRPSPRQVSADRQYGGVAAEAPAGEVGPRRAYLGPDVPEPAAPGYGERLPVLFRPRPRGEPIPDVTVDPYRDAAMRQYNEAVASGRPLLPEGAQIPGEGQHGWGKVMGDRQYGPVPPGGLPATKGSPRHPRHKYVKGGAPYPPARDVTTDMLGGQQLYEGARVITGKVKQALSRNTEYWKQFAKDAVSEIEGSPHTRAFSKHLLDEISFREIPGEIRKSGAPTIPVADIPKGERWVTRPSGVREKVDLTTEWLEKNLAPDFVRDVKSGKIKNVNPNTTVDRQAGAEGVGGRTHNSPFVLHFLRSSQMTDLSTMKGATELRIKIDDALRRNKIKGRDEDIAGRLMERYDVNQNEAQFLSDPVVLDLLAQSKSPRNMMNMIRETRAHSEEFHGIMDEMSRLYGGEGVGHLDAYFRKIPTQPSWWDVKEKVARAKARTPQKELRWQSKRDDKFNPAAQRRRSTDPEMVEVDGRTIPRDYNIRRVFDEYIDHVVNSVASTASIRHGAYMTRYLEKMGLDKAAEFTNKHIQGAYNNEKIGVMQNLDLAVENWGWVGRVGIDALTMNKRLFDASKYRFNPKFSFGAQVASLGLQAARHPVAATKALADLSNPAAWEAMRATYTSRVKNQPRAGVGFQADASPYTSDILKRPNVAQKAGRPFADGLTKGMEDFTNVASGMIARHTKGAKGLEGRDLTDYISTQQQKWQSMYTPRDRSPVLNSRIAQGTNPAQSYNIEFANRIRERVGKTIGVDTGNSQLANSFEAGYLIGARLVMDMTRYAALGYGGWRALDLLSALVGMIPYGQLLHGFGPGGGKTLTAGDFARVYYIADDIVEGDYGEAIQKSMRWVKGGTFMADMMDATEGEGPYPHAWEFLTGGPTRDRGRR